MCHSYNYTTNHIFNPLPIVLPSWVELEGQALAFYDAWYSGYELLECETRARNMADWQDFTNKYKGNEYNHSVFHNGPVGDAKYLVSIFRAGVDIYSHSPLADICADFIFSEWPKKVFELFEDDYKVIMRQLRGPSCAIDLPPLTALVLSLSNNRNNIPETIRDLREEYEQDRKELWWLMNGMWEAETIKEQIEIFNSLSEASKNIFKSAFPERHDALSLGLDFARMTPSGIASGLKQMREKDAPNAKVKAVSFAQKLSKDFRKNLLSSRSILKRHLTLAEYHNFGLG